MPLTVSCSILDNVLSHFTANTFLNRLDIQKPNRYKNFEQKRTKIGYELKTEPVINLLSVKKM